MRAFLHLADIQMTKLELARAKASSLIIVSHTIVLLLIPPLMSQRVRSMGLWNVAFFIHNTVAITGFVHCLKVRSGTNYWVNRGTKFSCLMGPRCLLTQRNLPVYSHMAFLLGIFGQHCFVQLLILPDTLYVSQNRDADLEGAWHWL